MRILAIACLLLGAITTITLSAAQPAFHQRLRFPVCPGAIAMCLTDLNGDGNLDVIAGADIYGFDSVSVLLGNGDGTFQQFINYHGSNNVRSVVARDFNGDGSMDIAVPECNTVQDSSDVSILFNGGNGTLQSPVSHDVQVGAFFLVAEDFDGNGTYDLAVQNSISHSVSVLFNYGNGSYAPAVNYPVSTGALSLTAADLNQDGHSDLAVGGFRDSVTILVNDGSGNFVKGGTFGVMNGSYAGDQIVVACGDLNGDGAPDLVVGHEPIDSLSVLLNNGDATFQPPTNYPAGHDALNVIIADLNNDLHPDVAVSYLVGNTISVYYNNGDGILQPEVPVEAAVGQASALAAGDVDNDGDLDLVTSDWASRSITVLINSTVQNYVCGDANHDGGVDISDAVSLIQYIFAGGPAPNPLLSGDVDCSLSIDISDAVFLIGFIFAGGPAPCAGC
jgi:hypothetical protein